MSKKIEWSPSLEVGIDLIDNAHKALIDQFNAFVDLEESEVTVAKVTSQFGGTLNALFHHFDEEEAFMKEMDYEHYLKHKAVHDQLRSDAKEIAYDLARADDITDMLPYVHCLERVIVAHIQDVDKDLVKLATTSRT